MKKVCLPAALAAALCANHAHAVLQHRAFYEAFGMSRDDRDKAYTVNQIKSAAPGNVFHPGEKVEVTLQFANLADTPVDATGHIEIVTYSSFTPGWHDFFKIDYKKEAEVARMPVAVKMDAKGYVDIPLTLPVPERLGGYIAIVELPEMGRRFASAVARVAPVANPGRVQHPTYALDVGHASEAALEAMLPMFQRCGIKAIRVEDGGWSHGHIENHGKRLEELRGRMKKYLAADITVMLTVAAHGGPWGGRPFLDDKDEFRNVNERDMAMLPEHDKVFQQWIMEVASENGWPKGPVNAIELWNEPWEGNSISGWGADMLRYREIYEHMALGIVEARGKAGVEVLIGGCSSSMNTDDKLFADGSDKFLKWLDFSSIHYQPLAPWHSLKPEFLNRGHALGPVRIWDTESWMVNVEGLIVGGIASMRASGLERTAGVLHDASYEVSVFKKRTPDGGQNVNVVHAWNNMAAISAMQNHIGERAFREILFKDGLPWVFVFDGLGGDEDDGCVVVMGTFEAMNNPAITLFGNVKLAPGATLTLADTDNRFRLYDTFGNVIEPKGGTQVVPLTGQGFIVGTDKSKGSMAALIDAIKAGGIQGVEPVRFEAKDMLARVENGSEIRLTVANNINRPVGGTLFVEAEGLEIETPRRDLALGAHERREIAVKVKAGKARADNAYPMTATFDGKDGKVAHTETLRVNLIAKKTMNIDGDLRDWEDVLPHMASRDGASAAGVTERAWFPFLPFDPGVTEGVAMAYMAYDDDYFYIAARVADTTPDEGGIRFETRDDDSYFYPEVAYRVERDAQGNETKRHELKWPEGVRRYTYRKVPDLPSSTGSDNLQLMFNVVPENEKPMLPHPKGTMPGYIAQACTDYEFAFNKVADKFGGGTEVWRQRAPGIPLKHFYPRQPKAPVDGGPVKEARLVMRHEDNTRVLEAALPWSEIPLVREKMLGKETVKLNFAINDNGGSAYELAARRSVSQFNTYARFNLWEGSWATEIEFAFE